MNIVKKCKKTGYASKIGPNTPKEAEMIHKGVYDAADVWSPWTFAKQLNEKTEHSFEEFEERELQYYVGFFITFYVLKWLGAFIALSYMPQVFTYL